MPGGKTAVPGGKTAVPGGKIAVPDRKEGRRRMTEVMKKRSEIITQLEQEFTEELIPVRVTVEEGDTQVLHILLEEFSMEGVTALVDCFFLPNEEDEDLQVFTTVMTLAEEIPEERAGELASAVAILDFFLPVGAFAIDPVGRRLVYKSSRVMEISLAQEEMAQQADLAIGVAIQVAEQYTPFLIDILEGTRSAASLTELMVEEYAAEDAD